MKKPPGDAFCTPAGDTFSGGRRRSRSGLLEQKSVMHSTLQTALSHGNPEERDVIERWFQNFQTIGLSKRQGMSAARGAAKINQVGSLMRKPFQ